MPHDISDFCDSCDGRLTAGEHAAGLRFDQHLCDDCARRFSVANPGHKDAVPLVNLVCAICGGDDVTRDAVVRWSAPDQEWAVSSIYDDATCGSCGEVDLQQKPIEPTEQSATTATFTVFVQRADGKGTTSITTQRAATQEAAIALAIQSTAEERACDANTLRTLGVAAGDVEILAWDDAQA